MAMVKLDSLGVGAVVRAVVWGEECFLVKTDREERPWAGSDYEWFYSSELSDARVLHPGIESLGWIPTRAPHRCTKADGCTDDDCGLLIDDDAEEPA